MIVVDSSALIAIARAEPARTDCMRILAKSEEILISATTLAETLIVGGRKGVSDGLAILLDELALTVVSTTAATAREVARAYDQWGRGSQRAQLNFADCFSYALAIEHACPLLFVGDDFAKTDVTPAWRPASGFHEP